MDRVAARRRGGGDHGRDAQVALVRRRRADADRAVGEPRVQRAFVRGRVDRDRLDPELVQRADDADGDLAAVRDQDAVEHAPRGVERASEGGLEVEERLAELDGLAVLDVDLADDALDLRLDLVHQLHRLEDAERLAGRHGVALLDEGRRARLRGAVEGADHRRLDAERAVGRRLRRSGFRARPLRRRPAQAPVAAACDRDRVLGPLAPRPASRPPRPRSRRCRSPARCGRPRGSARPASGRRSPPSSESSPLERSRIACRSGSASSPKSASRSSSSSLAARPSASSRIVVEVDAAPRLVVRAGDERDRPLDGRVDLPRRRAEAALEQVAQLVDDRLVAGRREDVDDRLRGEDLADRRGDRRRSGLVADDGQLVEDVVEAVGARRARGAACRSPRRGRPAARAARPGRRSAARAGSPGRRR